MIRLQVADSVRGGSVLDKTLTVIDAGAPNLLPTARFSVVPTVPAVGQSVRLDGSLSSDPEGPLARLEWDLDCDGSFETNGGRSPATSTSFATPGEKVIVLRVTDERGATATARRVINVVRESLPPRADSVAAGAAQARRPRSAELAFSARLAGKSKPGGDGTVHRRGRQLSLRGVAGGGRLLARALEVPGRSSPAERSLRRFLRARWSTRIGFSLDRHSRRLSARGTVLARSRRGRKPARCLRVRLAAGPGRVSTGRLTLLGGTGAGARLRGGAALRFRLEPSGSATVLGRVTARRAAPRPLPARCRGLARR